MAAGKFDDSGNQMTASGQHYVQQAVTAGAQIGAAGARRCVAFTPVAGAGNITLYDGTDNTGNVIYPTTAIGTLGVRVLVEIPCVLGIFAVVTSTAVVNITYS